MRCDLSVEHVRCELCGADDTQFLFTSHDRQFNLPGTFRAVLCRRCGLIYLNPRPDQHSILAYYPRHLRAFGRAGGDRSARAAADRVRQVGRHLLRAAPPAALAAAAVGAAIHNRPQLGHALARGANSKPPRVLDVGCGDGQALSRLNEQGWEAYGVEIDPVAAEHVRLTHGVPVFCGQLEDAEWPDGHFDLVIFHHTLEHLPHPLASLRETHRILKSGGEVMVEVPNVHSLQANLFRSRWVYWDIPRHLYAFSDATLRHMLERAGFSATQVHQVARPGGFAGSLQYLCNDLVGAQGNRTIWSSTLVRIAFWPVAWSFARLGYSDCVSATATKCTPDL